MGIWQKFFMIWQKNVSKKYSGAGEERKMFEGLPMEETNNYEKWCEQWRKKFLKMDQEELKRRLPELKEEGNWLTISHFGRRLGVHKENGRIIAMEDHDPVTCYERLNVYTLFGYVSPLWPITKMTGCGLTG